MIPETVNQGQNLGRHSRFYFHFYSFLFCSFCISLDKKNVFFRKDFKTDENLLTLFVTVSVCSFYF
jgi:hypothetical protein